MERVDGSPGAGASVGAGAGAGAGMGRAGGGTASLTTSGVPFQPDLTTSKLAITARRSWSGSSQARLESIFEGLE